MRRDTCLYCEQDGIKTFLVPVGDWGCCPVHSAVYIKSALLVPDGYALVKKPVLLELGVPSRANHDIKKGEG